MVNYKTRYLSTLNITILGAYYPEKSKNRLIKLRNYLQENGFSNTRLVDEIHYPLSMNILIDEQDKKNVLNSHYAIQSSNALIFVFGLSDKSCGHYQELQYFYDNLYAQLINTTLFLIEKDTMRNLSSLIRGYIKSNKNSPGTYYYKTFKELCEYSKYQLLSMFTK